MNFDLTEEQQMIQEQAAKFVAAESPVSRFRKLREDEIGWDKAMWAKMAEQGWLSIAVPEEQGGFGGSFLDMAVILEQLGRGLSVLDASRPWLCYWIVHSLELLGAPVGPAMQVHAPRPSRRAARPLHCHKTSCGSGQSHPSLKAAEVPVVRCLWRVV